MQQARLQPILYWLVSEGVEKKKTSVRTNVKKVVGQHFNEPGHSIFNMEVAALEKVFDRGKQIIEKRESMWIEILEAEFKGLNQKL